MVQTLPNVRSTLWTHLERYKAPSRLVEKGRGYNEFCKLLGGFYSYENTYNEKTGEWHPHLHIFGVLENWIDQEALSETWHEITLDSYIVDIRRVRKHKKLGYGEAIAEVCKYALKFGDLSVEKDLGSLHGS